MESKSEITPSNPITLDQAKYIQGPIALSEYYSAKYDKHIFLFSDEHQRLPRCPPDSTPENTISISDAIHQLVTEDKSQTVDVYLEIPFISKSTDRQKFSASSGFIGDVAATFAPCFLVEKKKCPYSNARFHYVDVRSWQDQKDMNARKYLEAYLHLAVQDFNRGKKLSQLYQDEISKRRWAFDKQLDIKDLLERLKITKQLENIPEENVRTEIYEEFVPKLIENSPKNSSWFLDMALLGLTIGKPRGNTSMAQMVINLLQDFGVALMDMYLLARMFRTYKNGSRSQRDIVYAGVYHTDIYDTFLVDTLGFTKLQATQDSKDSYQCINITEFAPYVKFKT